MKSPHFVVRFSCVLHTHVEETNDHSKPHVLNQFWGEERTGETEYSTLSGECAVLDIGHYDHPVLVLHYFYIPELLAFSVLQFREASLSEDDTELIRVMSNYGMQYIYVALIRDLCLLSLSEKHCLYRWGCSRSSWVWSGSAGVRDPKDCAWD